MVVAGNRCEPALTGMPDGQALVEIRPERAGIFGHLDEIFVAADGNQADPFAIQADLDLVRIFHAAHQVEGISPQPDLNNVFAVDRESCA